MLRKRVIEIRLVLIFILSGTRRAHHGENAFARDRLRPAQRFDFAGLLDQAQRTENVLRIADGEIGEVPLNASEQAMRRAIGLFRRESIEIEIDFSVVPAGRERGKIALKGLNGAHVAHAGNGFRLLGLYASARPALGKRVRRQKIQPLLNAAVRILRGEQHGGSAFQSCQIHEIAIGEEGIVFVAGLPKLFSRENGEQASRLHALIQPFAIADVIGSLHLKKPPVCVRFLHYIRENVNSQVQSRATSVRTGKSRRKFSLVRCCT